MLSPTYPLNVCSNQASRRKVTPKRNRHRGNRTEVINKDPTVTGSNAGGLVIFPVLDKTKLKNYGVKWVNEDTAFNGFLAIFNHKHDTLPDWIKQVHPLFYDNEKLLLRFLAVTGLRKSEALTSFNMIIELNAKGKLCEYYNEDFSTLEHFKYGKLFLRGTKNAFISVVSKAMITEIANSQPVSYNAIHCRLMRKKIPLRLKELRSYQNSCLRKNGIISELVDVVAGRVPKSVFTRHYLGQDMKAFGRTILNIESKLEEFGT